MCWVGKTCVVQTTERAKTESHPTNWWCPRSWTCEDSHRSLSILRYVSSGSLTPKPAPACAGWKQLCSFQSKENSDKKGPLWPSCVHAQMCMMYTHTHICTPPTCTPTHTCTHIHVHTEKNTYLNKKCSLCYSHRATECRRANTNCKSHDSKLTWGRDRSLSLACPHS